MVDFCDYVANFDDGEDDQRSYNKDLIISAGSDHGIVEVREGLGRRYMRFTNMFGRNDCEEQSAMLLDNPHHHVYEYSILAMYSLMFNRSPERVLVVGLGGGTIVKEINHLCPDARIDSIEINPVVIDFAQSFFNVERSDKINIIEGDAFKECSELEKGAYDIVILDAYNETYIPYHLRTIDFLRSVNLLLKDGGVVAANVCRYHHHFKSQVHSFSNIFGSDSVYSINGIINDATTFLYCLKGDLEDIPIVDLPSDYMVEENVGKHAQANLKPQKLNITDDIEASDVIEL
jgi:spermidine synthase